MRFINLTILITIIVNTYALTSCNQTNKSDNMDNAFTTKEIELLKKENELLKKELELNQKKTETTISSTVKQQTDNSTSNNLDFLKKANGKYPYEVKLLDNPVLTQRLKKLLGNNRFKFLNETWAVEIPMEFTNNIFVASACQAHSCYSTNFIIVVDFSKNVMFVGIREEDEVKTYSEDGSNSPIITKWVNREFGLN